MIARGKITETRPEGPQGRILAIEVPKSHVEHYRAAGQYCELSLDQSLGYFSIVDPPGVQGHLFRFYVQDDGGEGTRTLLSASAGDEIIVTAPQGQGYGVERICGDPGNFVVGLCMGSGYFGLRAALIAVAERGLRTTVYAGFRDEVSQLGTHDHALLAQLGVEFRICLSQPSEDWDGRRGYVQTMLLAEGMAQPRPWVLACGSSDMLRDAREMCRSLGLPSGRFLTNY